MRSESRELEGVGGAKEGDDGSCYCVVLEGVAMVHQTHTWRFSNV